MRLLVGRCPNCKRITAVSVHETLSDAAYNAEHEKEWKERGLIVAFEDHTEPLSLKNSCNTRACRAREVE